MASPSASEERWDPEQERLVADSSFAKDMRTLARERLQAWAALVAAAMWIALLGLVVALLRFFLDPSGLLAVAAGMLVTVICASTLPSWGRGKNAYRLELSVGLPESIHGELLLIARPPLLLLLYGLAMLLALWPAAPLV